MSIAISDALQQAEQALQSGDLRSAIQTCNQLVTQFPDYAAAYRVMGDAYLAQGRTDEAEQAFAQALMRDPRQSQAYHGLGLIAERQNVLENALAFCQVAWELAPNQPELREPVVRIASSRFGTDGQAQLTSAALAQIYANTSRLQRAATEYRGALADLPDRVDLKLGLAQTLWQLNRNEEAADLCREVLEEHPVAIQALVILADIEGRSGQRSEADDLRARIRAIDPDGRITAVMVANNDYADREALLLADDAIPVMDAAAEAVVAERPHIAPAPDFSYQPARAEQPVQDIEDLEPISAEEFGEEAEFDYSPADQVTAELPVAGDDDSMAGFEAEVTGQDTVAPFTPVEDDDIFSIYRTDEDDAAVTDRLATAEPEREGAEEDLQAEPEADTDAAALLGESVAASDDDLDALLAEFGDVEPMGLDEFGAEPEDLERLASVEQDLLADDDIFAGFDLQQDQDSSENEHVRSLASALESDVAGVLDRTGEFQTVSAEPEPVSEPEPEPEEELVAEPDVELHTLDVKQPEDVEDIEVVEPPAPDQLSGTGYTTVLRELGDEGLTPFDPMGRADMQDSPAQAHFAASDTGAGQADDDNELAKLTEDWENIDDEIARAVPLTTGQTDQLRAADDLGIDPFDFEIEDDTSRLPAYRPFGEDDDELPEAEFDSDLDDAFEGEDVVVAPDAAAAQPEPEVETAEEPAAAEEAPAVQEVAEDDLFANLEPFSLDEFEDEEAGEQQFSFGALPWETQESGSAVPSDADLEALLSDDDQPQQETPEEVPAEPDWPTRVLDTSGQAEEPVDWTTAIQDTEPEPEVEAGPEPAETPWNIPDDWDSSLAVTRQIGGDSQDDFAERLAAAEAAAQAAAEPEQIEAEEEQAEEPTTVTGLLRGADPEHIVSDQDLFERSRSYKTDLISQGAIGGNLELEADDRVIEPEPEPEIREAAHEELANDVTDEGDFEVTTAASRDVSTLRASLEAAPQDDELHWWLAEALRERGDISEAYVEYRWIIRNAAHRADDVIEALNVCIEDEQHAEVGHRLLGDIYRRRGQVSLASSHAAAAMAVRRRLRG